MQIFGIRDNFPSSKTPLDAAVAPLPTRIFTKLESSYWNNGEETIRFLPDLTGEVEIVARIDAPVNNPVSEHEASALPISYALGIDFGSSTLGKQDGQWWRSKGTRGFAPVGRFVSGEVLAGDLRDHAVDISVTSGETTQSRIALGGMRDSVTSIVSHISEHCRLGSGDLIFLGALCFVRDFSMPKDITATSGVLHPFRLQSDLLPDDTLRLNLVEDIG